MPETLKEFLESLGETEREAIWEYLDHNPAAIDEMIAIVAE